MDLTPETIVTVINRGHATLVRMFDARNYAIRPHTVGLHTMPYGAALHFQKHCVVQGTREFETGAQESYLGIIGVDQPAACEPFTVEECEQFGQRIEALSRTAGEVEAVTWDDPQAGRKLANAALDQSRGRRAPLQGGETLSGKRVEVKDALAPVDADEPREIDPGATGAVPGETPSGIRSAISGLADAVMPRRR